MAKRGLTPTYQRPRTSDPHPQHQVYPYLLRKLTIERPNHIWCADVTHIPMRRGFLYLVAIMGQHPQPFKLQAALRLLVMALPPARPRRTLLQSAQTVPRHCNPLRQGSLQFHGGRQTHLRPYLVRHVMSLRPRYQAIDRPCGSGLPMKGPCKSRASPAVGRHGGCWARYIL